VPLVFEALVAQRPFAVRDKAGETILAVECPRPASLISRSWFQAARKSRGYVTTAAVSGRLRTLSYWATQPWMEMRTIRRLRVQGNKASRTAGFGAFMNWSWFTSFEHARCSVGRF